MFAGKDVSWDVINHQLYLPFSWVTGRFRTDLFGAGGQSYQNPLGYFPIYALITLGLPAWVIGVVLSAVHALVLWPLSRIARVIWPRDNDEDFWWRVLAIALCCVAPIFLIHDGTASTDPLTSLFILWAVALSLERGQANVADRRLAFRVGACLGLATAVKMSNAVFAVALVLVWLLKWIVGQADLGRFIAFAFGMIAAFALGAGAWMFWLWHDFDNPIYPLYNNVFHSPFASQEPLIFHRFVPLTALAALRRVWELATLSSYVSFEGFLPDIRPILATLAAVAALLALAVRGGWRRMAHRETWAAPGLQLAVSLVLMGGLWIRTSGNQRYGIALFMLIGVALVRSVQLVLPRKVGKVLLLTALTLQIAYFLVASEYRFGGTSWDGGPYLTYRVPERLRLQPFLHLTIGTQTNASVALFLDPRGALANPIGGMALPTTGPLGDRFESLLTQWRGRTRLLFVAPQSVTPKEVQFSQQGLRDLLYRLGLDVDWSDCEKIDVLLQGEAPDSAVIKAPDRRLLSCAVLYRSERDTAIDQQRVRAEQVFAIMEAACPSLLGPPPLASEYGAHTWQRQYLNSEARLSVSLRDGVSISHFRRIHDSYFGSIDDVLNHRNLIQCPQIEYQTPM